jgi:NTE family protein
VDAGAGLASGMARAAGSPTFAVAFGGGGARGLAHIHAIEALDELGIRPVAIAGSSIGAIMGAGMSAGMSGAEIRDYARTTLGNRAQLASRLWRAKPGRFDEVFSLGLRVSQFNIERILDAFLPAAVPKNFDKLGIPLKVTATDFYAHELVVYESGALYPALAASAAIPAVFRPVRLDGRILIDGGMYNPVPVDLVEGLADIVVAIDVVGAPEGNGTQLPNTIDLMFGASQLMMQSIIAMKLEKHRPAVFLRPPVSRFRALDFMKVEAVLTECEGFKDEVKRAVDGAVAALEKRRLG